MSELKGRINSFESFALVDGPGVRYCVFLQGCRMRCKYCHNPETWANEGGTELTSEELLKKVTRYRNYWSEDGGVTVSGGEPLLQLDFLTEFLTLCKAEGINTCVDTSGNPFSMEPEYLERFDKLMAVTDLFMLDLKEIEPDKHKELTGQPNSNILEMAKYLSDNGKDMWIRHVLVPGLTDDEDGLKKTADFIKSLKTVKKVEVLPYHTLGLSKWEKLGIPYPLDGVHVPSEELVCKAEEILGADKHSN
ncbi:MAG: pyruvate formate lyase-activating protein [Lachnospiraceae bacterium]|nr:pyruvate formate lyase-activating protein [Lachnospiraceae bacterium]